MKEWLGALDHVAHGGKSEIVIALMMLLIILMGFVLLKAASFFIKLYARPMYDNIKSIVGLAPALNEIVVTNKQLIHKVNNLATQVHGFQDQLKNHEEDVWQEINVIKERIVTLEAKTGMR